MTCALINKENLAPFYLNTESENKCENGSETFYKKMKMKVKVLCNLQQKRLMGVAFILTAINLLKACVV